MPRHKWKWLMSPGGVHDRGTCEACGLKTKMTKRPPKARGGGRGAARFGLGQVCARLYSRNGTDWFERRVVPPCEPKLKAKA